MSARETRTLLGTWMLTCRSIIKHCGKLLPRRPVPVMTCVRVQSNHMHKYEETRLCETSPSFENLKITNITSTH